MEYNKLILSYSDYTLKRDYVEHGTKYSELWFYATPLEPRLAHINIKLQAWRRWYTNDDEL